MLKADDPASTAKRRQTCTHPGTISATLTCNAIIHGPWKHLMIANQIQRASKTGFYWNVWENKWVFNCDLGVCLCVADVERQIIPGYGTLMGERSLAWVFLFEQKDLQFTCVCGRQVVCGFTNFAVMLYLIVEYLNTKVITSKRGAAELFFFRASFSLI